MLACTHSTSICTSLYLMAPLKRYKYLLRVTIYSAYSSSSVCLSVSIMEHCSRDASTFCRQPDCGLRGTLKISIDSGMRLCYICPKHKDIIRWGDEKGINQTNPRCSCSRPSRRTRQQDRFYFQCAKNNCGFWSMYPRSYENCP
jgi:hypothetical protein